MPQELSADLYRERKRSVRRALWHRMDNDILSEFMQHNAHDGNPGKSVSQYLCYIESFIGICLRCLVLIRRLLLLPCCLADVLPFGAKYLLPSR